MPEITQVQKAEGISAASLSKLEKLKLQISQNLDQKQEAQASYEDKEETTELELAEPLTEAEFNSVWKIYLQKLEQAGKSSLTSFLKSSKVELLDPFIVSVEVRSNLERDQLDQERLDMVPFFRKELKQPNLDFRWIVNSSLIQQTHKLSKEEQLKKAIEQNPLVGDLVKALGLEIEY